MQNIAEKLKKTNKWKNIPIQGLENLILNCPYYPK